MFKTKFKAIEHDGSFIVIYKKRYQLSWNMLAVNGDPYKFDNENAAEYMIKCLEGQGYDGKKQNLHKYYKPL